MTDGRRRVVIENMAPQVEGGRFPAKRAVGEVLTVTADIFVDGHDALQALVLHRLAGAEEVAETRMSPGLNDSWSAEIPVAELHDIYFTVEAWVDHFASWRQLLEKKIASGQDVAVELLDGAALVCKAAERAAAEGVEDDAGALQRFAAVLEEGGDGGAQAAAEPLLALLMGRHADRTLASRFPEEFYVHVEPPLAAFSAWYELFPRSAGPPGRHGTLRDVIAQLPRVAAMGFDILYLPPIHPIGETFRKGANNTPGTGSGEVGSPWAIGSSAGGHTAIHPELGTFEDFAALIAAAQKAKLEIALDIAFQCSPDHPWVREHPEWFRIRADGSIQYAENPPKKYQDIYPFDFECPEWESLWEALRDVFLFWVGQGVRIFRVDNPHTKPIAFWTWCLAEVRKSSPEAIFLAEAFTRPKVMYRLAKAGFTQSYTYFTWRNSKEELTRYMTGLVHSAPRDFFRPNFWPNTPDILPEYLQYGGRPAFLIRLVLAATLSSNYGIYGPAFELCEGAALPGTEEYLDSEKYQIRDWDLKAPGSLESFIGRLNVIRRAHPALQQTWNLRFLEAENDFVLFFAKYDNARQDLILVAVNLDPHHTQSAWLNLPLEEFALDEERSYMVHDLLGDDKFIWQGPRNLMAFDPQVLPARIFHLKRRLKRETDFDYFM
ncbi:alpha-1,4-glucan:maltose-1-phosphate maltosyltransferase [Desulfuromonas soudanensis]|uniref:Alpha-1,4-glucan:maltose-1-phosphate maltosyltransferase n=1 Tax=Desulfuromonas soudanensis TaxID=1603606 RepID=A0A0M4CYC0_9BACT|nr:alpha-1,4-glucan--maltose-1-phosphate maltosyltransferase [Desulfuromonas soudanensis]ALC15340.1 alpha-1,4-glucan:maltose-1-phosphate maltosyltransferase [Desulfuromonas soudanensis]